MQGSYNPSTTDNENSVLNGSWREGKFRLKYATNFKLLALLYGQAHAHTQHEVHLHFIPKEKQSIKNRFTFMVNDVYDHSGPAPWKSQ